MTLYDYTTPNSQLVKDLKLEKHIEGGEIAREPGIEESGETQRDEHVVASPLAGAVKHFEIHQFLADKL
ncbi:hypothetical protein FRC00_000256 [Tulasnella sp. 408]|nr:hypothetical protein FRC00_000256 [Tulasnella sp. 408]